MAGVRRGNLGQEGSYYHLRDLVLKSGCCRQCYQVESRRPLRGVCRRLEEPRPELDIDLNPGESESRGRVPGLGSKTQVQVVDGSGPTKKCS
jgi:hypothetical protein